MSNWFETIVPNDRTWSSDNIRPVKTVKTGDATDIARYLSTVLERTNDPRLDGDNFTAIVNIKNGFIPANGDYSGFSIQIEGIVAGEQVNKTVTGSNEPVATEYVWYVRKITFFVSGRQATDHTKETVIDAGDDWIMRATTRGDEVAPGFGKGAKYGSWWANNAEFNPKITSASRISIKNALRKDPGTEQL
jgi:hypothetical protein|uniref:Uncharacterized protein n=1 Tax=Siphoviridae sp. ctcK97 TaxID=2825571 RepID=A0A8S5UB94_9CAUD|nr:MAG TPA: hypothetical protein [Siphoviridae sp. ctcK97]